MQGQQMGTQDINTLLGIGGLQQGQAQQALNVAQQNALAQQQLPFQQLGFLGDIFRGVPALQQQTTQTYTPPPSLSSQLLGLGIAGLGAFGAFEQ
jgi:3-deoxy-D-manno-octulosonate 8-phosphate phosphatase KdsC-like HAD superfamily phosphatase